MTALARRFCMYSDVWLSMLLKAWGKDVRSLSYSHGTKYREDALNGIEDGEFTLGQFEHQETWPKPLRLSWVRGNCAVKFWSSSP